jgi:hypothetical protein
MGRWTEETEAVRARRAEYDRANRAQRAAEARTALEAHPEGVRPGDWEAVAEQERLAAEGR